MRLNSFMDEAKENTKKKLKSLSKIHYNATGSKKGGSSRDTSLLFLYYKMRATFWREIKCINETADD